MPAPCFLTLFFPVCDQGRGSTFRLHTLFMAASPIGQSVQNFEAEENSILAFSGDSGMDLIVEESDSLKGLLA